MIPVVKCDSGRKPRKIHFDRYFRRLKFEKRFKFHKLFYYLKYLRRKFS